MSRLHLNSDFQILFLKSEEPVLVLARSQIKAYDGKHVARLESSREAESKPLKHHKISNFLPSLTQHFYARVRCIGTVQPII
jgi:hypothetical protein